MSVTVDRCYACHCIALCKAPIIPRICKSHHLHATLHVSVINSHWNEEKLITPITITWPTRHWNEETLMRLVQAIWPQVCAFSAECRPQCMAPNCSHVSSLLLGLVLLVEGNKLQFVKLGALKRLNMLSLNAEPLRQFPFT